MTVDATPPPHPPLHLPTPLPPSPPRHPASARAAAGPRGGVPRERALPTRRAGGARRAARRRSQRPPSDRRTATRDSQGARVRRVVRVHGSVTPRGGHGGDRKGLGCPTRRTGRGTRLARPLVRQSAGGTARTGSAGPERSPSRTAPSPIRPPAAGRPAAPPGTATPDATPRGAARARRPSRVVPQARGAFRRRVGRRRPGAGGDLRGGRRGARRAARVRVARARVPVPGGSERTGRAAGAG